MKCNHCQAEWTLPPSMSAVLKTCPFCGADLLPKAEEKPDSMQGVLKVIIRRSGVDALKDGRRTLAMFSDLAPDLRKEKTMFSYLLQCDGHAVLLEALTKARSQQIATRAVLIQRMTDELLLSEAAAIQACDGFWAAIGGQAFETVSKSVPAPAPKPAPKPAPAPAPQSPAASALVHVLTNGARCAALRSRIGDRMITCGYQFIAALDVNGRVHVAGKNASRVHAAEQWRNIIAIYAGFAHLVGLKADGTVCSAGYNTDGEGNVGNWTGIVDIAAGNDFTIGLKADGTVLYTGARKYQGRIPRWKGIVSIGAGKYHAVGLKADGTVVAEGDNTNKQCNVSSWNRIDSIFVSADCTFGIRTDGSWVTTSSRYAKSPWTDVACLSAGYTHAVGLTRSGSPLQAGTNTYNESNIKNWTNLLNINARENHTVGLKDDGTLLYTGEGNYDLKGWKLFDSPDQLDAWLTTAEERKKRLMARR